MKTIPFIPTADNIIVLPFEEADRTKSGLYIPDSHKKPLNQGIVIKTGPDVKTLAEGNVVLWPLFSGNSVIWERDQYLFLQEHEVMGYIESKEELLKLKEAE